MRFGVLGPLDVQGDDGQTVPLTSSKQRLLLAVLLAHRNTWVSTDRLIDMLWEGMPPTSSRTNLQGYVHRLRKLIGDSRIIHRQASYELVVRPPEADDSRFEALAHDGRKALDAGDAQRAADLLRQALQLWRGEQAYADTAASAETVGLEAARLDELRHLTLERRIDADLRLGRHARLIPELATLVATYPLRQRLNAHLMLALHRSGRTAEALECYRRARQVMVDELGLEPSTELRELERAIISDDPALRLAPDGAAVKGSQQPHPPPRAELPALDPSFTGRHHELATLAGFLNGDGQPAARPAMVAVSGPAGIGKSALVQHAAHGMAEDYPDGALYIDLQGAAHGSSPLDPRDVLARFLRILGVAESLIPEDTEGAAALFRSILSSSRILVVLDNAQDAAQIRPLLPGPNSPSAVLMTCRRALTAIAGIHHLRLGTLSADESVVLLARLAGPDRVAAEPDIATETVRLCGHLPLAVRIVAARLIARPDWPLSAMHTRLTSDRGRLDELQHDDLAVRTSLDVTSRTLTDTAAEVFAHLGLVDLHDFTAVGVAALVGRPLSQVRRDLDRLVESQLVTAVLGERFTLQDLLRLYAREKADSRFSVEYRVEATGRLLRHFLFVARSELRGNGSAGSDGDETAASDWVRAESDNIVAVARHATALPDQQPSLLAELALVLADPLKRQGRWHTLISLSRLALSSSEPSSDTSWLAGLHYQLGEGYAVLGHVEKSRIHGEEALPASRKPGDLPRQSLVLANLGLTLHLAGRAEDAAEAYEHALRAADNVHVRGLVLSRLSAAHRDAGRPRDALTCAQQAVDIFQAAGWGFDEALARWLCGELHQRLNQGTEAKEQWSHAARVLKSIGAISDQEAADLLHAPSVAMPDVLARYRPN